MALGDAPGGRLAPERGAVLGVACEQPVAKAALAARTPWKIRVRAGPARRGRGTDEAAGGRNKRDTRADEAAGGRNKRGKRAGEADAGRVKGRLL
jgi:hypothetical protein